MSQTPLKPGIEVIAGPAHSAKTSRIIDAFRQTLSVGDEAVLILPTARAARSLRTELLLDGTFECFGGPRILTFIQFAEYVLERHAPGIRPIDPTVEDELLTHVISELAAAGRLPYHTRVLNFRGFVRAVRAFIMELKRAEVRPIDFARFAERTGAADKDRELSAVYSRYQETLQKLGLYDGEGRFWWAKLLVSDGKLGPFAGVTRLFLDGFYDFTPTQLGLIEVLAARGVKPVLSLPLEEAPTRRELFESAEATLAKLRERFEPTVQLLPTKELTTPDLAWLAENLFRSTTPDGAPEPVSIRLIETPGIVAEVREIAREIKRLHVEEDVPLEQIAVVFRTLAEYSGVVGTVFEEFGIPVSIGRGARLSMTSVGQLFLQMLRVPVEGWHARAVMSLLKSDYVSTAAVGLDGDGFSTARFEELALEAGIIRGRSSWIRNLRVLRERVASQMASADDTSDDEVRHRLDGTELQDKHRDLERAEQVSEKLFRLFDGLGAASTTGGIRDALLDLARALNVEREIIDARDKELAAADLACLAAVRDCLEDLVRTAAVVDESKCTPGDFLEAVQLAFADRTVRRRGVDFGCVQVCDVHEVRALVFDVVFIGGLLERSFPRMHREGPFYDDRERTRMSDRGLGVQPRRLNQREERFLFYLAATRAKQKLYLWYPVTDREGKEKLVSYYVGEVRRIFAPHEIASRMVTLSTKVAGLEESSSVSELRRATVLKLGEARLGKPDRQKCASALAVVRESERKEGRRSLPVLKRGLEGEAERDSWDPFGSHDGMLSHPEAVRELGRRFGADYSFSTTTLEEYGCCPFAFFCHKVLGVEAPAEPPEELEAVDEGTILHRTLRQFYAERRERSEDVGVRDDEVEAATTHIRRIAEGHLDRFHGRNPDLNEGLYRLQCEGMHELLGDFVRAEAAARRKDSLGMVPRFFEVAFGLRVNPEIADPHSTEKRLVIDIQDGPVVGIVGKIDRIDVTAAAVDDAGRRGFRVIDYKRGRAPGGTRGIEEGTAFQMPVYLLAARDVILADETLVPVDARFYGLREMKTRPALRLLESTKDGVQPNPEADALMNAAVDYIRDYVGAIRRGCFPVLRRGLEACPGYCEFREICRFSELRAEKKSGEFKPWFEHRRTSARTKGGST